jgi:aryl sulfotransferase
MDLAPCVDMRCLPLDDIKAGLGAQTHRRAIKTHLPADALPMALRARYIYAARDVRTYFHEWLDDDDGGPMGSYWTHIQSRWDMRDRPNVLLVHFTI